jgi:hypothetical protein
MTRRGRERPGLGGLWLLLVPVLAAAGAPAQGGLRLVLAVLLAGAMPVIRSCRRACGQWRQEARQARDSGTMTSP